MFDIPTIINPLSEDELTQLAQECVKRLPEKPFLDFRLWVGGTEVDRRKAEAAETSGIVAFIKSMRASGVLESPVVEADSVEGFTAWTDPAGNKAAMPLAGDRFQAGGRVWESLRDLNPLQPGLPSSMSAWADITDRLFPTVTPTEPYTTGKAWRMGDEAEYEGRVYTCLVDHFAIDGWTPDTAPTLWAVKD